MKKYIGAHVSASGGVEGIWWAVSVTTVAKGLILLSWFIIIRKKCLNLPSVVGK